MPRGSHSKLPSNPNSDNEKKYKSIAATAGVLLLVVLSFKSVSNDVEVEKRGSFSKRVGNPSLSQGKSSNDNGPDYEQDDDDDIAFFEKFHDDRLTDDNGWSDDFAVSHDFKETNIFDVTSTSFDVHALRDSVRDATAILKESLKSKYGKYYDVIFESAGPKLFEINQVSKDRLLRRMMKKIIETSTKNSKVPFTWVTAGHSACAGHGNLFSQSKTHVLEEMASKAFSAAGLNFIGKNYAMGGMGSGPELGMCMEQIYGTDIDVITWDFGMTDGRDYWKLALWGARGANHPTRPFQVLMDSQEARRTVFQKMENVGVGLFTKRGYGDMKEMAAVLPDYENDKSQTDVPESLKYLVCGGIMEEGECKSHKWNTTAYCTKVAGQVGWHPGWRFHQLDGSLLALYMVLMLNESLDLLVSMSSISNDRFLTGDMHDLEILLNDINSKDKTDYEAWMNSPSALLPEKIRVASTSFHKGDPICSSALLPSDARYNGYVTGKEGVFGGDFDTGMTESDAQLRSESTNGLNVSMTVVHSNHRTKVMCPKYADRDYKDYYYVGKVEDDKVWHTRIVPSHDEYDAFSKSTVSTENFIMACLEKCDWGRCPNGYVGFTDEASVYIDNRKVEKVEKEDNCYLLFPSNGDVTWVSKGEKPGQYEIEVKLNGGGFMRISSIIIVPFIS